MSLSQREWDEEFEDLIGSMSSTDSAETQEGSNSNSINSISVSARNDEHRSVVGEINDRVAAAAAQLGQDPFEIWSQDLGQESDSDSDSSESGVDKVLDCARRPQASAATRRRGGTKKRKTYSDKDYRMIINAPNDFKRRVIAEAIDMPWRTALGIMRRFKKTGKVHDERKDHHVNRNDQRNNPYSQSNRGKWGKLSPVYEDYLFHLVHFNCAQTMEDLKELLNREIMRDFLIENEVLPTDAHTAASVPVGNGEEVIQSGIIFGIKALPEGERKRGDPLDTAAFEEVEEFKEFCERCLIKSPQTIVNHMNKAGYTRKNLIVEQATENKPTIMALRLRVAQLLRAVVDGKSSKKFLLFQDEMPFYLNQYRKRGIAKKGQRTVYRGVPTSNMSFRTQVSMVANPDLGVIVSKQYNPKKIEYVNKHGKKKAKWKSGYTKTDFEDFVHLTMTHVMTLFGKDDSLQLMENSEIVLIIDGVPEHGKKGMDKMVENFEHKERFDKILQEHCCSFRHLKLPPNSPHLNLCEYYNRVLRSYVTNERNKPDIHREMMRIQGDTEVEPGQIVANRVNTMHDCIELAFEQLHNNRGAIRENFMNFYRWLQKIIDSNGYLNYYEPL